MEQGSIDWNDSADVRDVNSVRHIVSATNKRVLGQWNRDQYHQLPNRATVGNPTIYYYSQGAETDSLRICMRIS